MLKDASAGRPRRRSLTSVPPVPPDPIGAISPVDYAGRLHALMLARGRSLDSVARRSSDAGTPISRATVHNLTTAAGVPRRDSVVAFLRGCGVPPREQIRWLTTFDRIFRDVRNGRVA